jgi:hypothetical protein
MRALVLIIMICMGVWPFPALADQKQNVEINLDVLEGYTPPPMFEGKTLSKPVYGRPALKPPRGYQEPSPLKYEIIRPKPKKIVTAPKKITVPRPARKPKFTAAQKPKERLKIAAEPMAQEKTNDPEDKVLKSDPLKKSLSNPSASDVLDKIDGPSKPKKISPLPKAEPAIVLAEPLERLPEAKKQAPVPKGEALTLEFTPGDASLTEGMKTVLIKEFVDGNSSEKSIEIRAYAASAKPAASGASEAGPSEIRRLSLERALTIRTFLMDKGIAPARLIVRPLGQDPEGGPAERAEVRLLP